MICLLTFAYYSYSYSYNYNNNYYDSDYGYCAGGIIHSLILPTTTSTSTTPASTHTRTQQTRTNFTPCGYLNAKGCLAYLRFSTLHRHESPQSCAALYIHTRHRHTTRESPLSALRPPPSVLCSPLSVLYIHTYLPTYIRTDTLRAHARHEIRS